LPNPTEDMMTLLLEILRNFLFEFLLKIRILGGNDHL
jgi:hypothetical protein